MFNSLWSGTFVDDFFLTDNEVGFLNGELKTLLMFGYKSVDAYLWMEFF